MRVRTAMTALAAGLLASASVFASGVSVPGASGAVGGLEISERTLVFEPVRSGEIRIEPSQDMGPVAAPARIAGRGIEVRFAPPTESVSGFVQRDVPSLWKMRIAPGKSLSANPNVRVQLEGLDGQPNVLSCVDTPGVAVPAFVRPSTTRSVPTKDGVLELTGGAAIQIPLAGLTRACRYAGRLVVRLEGF